MLKITNKPECKNRDFLLKIAREETAQAPKKVLTPSQYEMAFWIFMKSDILARKEFEKLFKEVVGISFIEYSKRIRYN